jgi:hypothetical protein
MPDLPIGMDDLSFDVTFSLLQHYFPASDALVWQFPDVLDYAHSSGIEDLMAVGLRPRESELFWPVPFHAAQEGPQQERQLRNYGNWQQEVTCETLLSQLIDEVDNRLSPPSSSFGPEAPPELPGGDTGAQLHNVVARATRSMDEAEQKTLRAALLTFLHPDHCPNPSAFVTSRLASLGLRRGAVVATLREIFDAPDYWTLAACEAAFKDVDALVTQKRQRGA